MNFIKKLSADIIISSITIGTLFVTGCKSEYDKTVYEDNFMQPPKLIENLHQKIDYENQQITLSWDLPEKSNIKSLFISAWTDETCKTLCTTAGSLAQQKTIPVDTSYSVKGIALSRKYCFSVQSIGENGVMNNIKKTITYSPIEHNSLFTYKLTETAYDFGYSENEKKVEIIWAYTGTKTIKINPEIVGTSLTATGRFGIISWNKESVEPGDKVSFNVKYIPGKYNPSDDSTASWDEAELLITKTIEPSPYIKLLASNFPQPVNIGTDEKGSHLKLWLRPELIDPAEIEYDEVSDVHLVSKIPDYSGNNFNAFAEHNKSINLDQRPYYKADVFKNSPALLYTTKDKRMISSGDIVSNSYSGSTAFIILKRSTPSVIQDKSYLLGYYLSGSNGADYTFPMVESRYTSYSPNNEKGYASSSDSTYRVPSFAVCDSGFFDGTYRYLFDQEKSDNGDASNRPVKVDVNTPYSVCTIYDKDKTTHNHSSNLYSYLNGKKMLVSYTYTRESAPDSTTLTGAFGAPWSDGNGNLNRLYMTDQEFEEYQNPSLRKHMDYDEGIKWNSSEAEDYYFHYMLNPDEHGNFKNDLAIRWWYNKFAVKTASTDYSQYYKNDIKANTDNYLSRANIIKYLYIGSRPNMEIYSPEIITYSNGYDPYVYIADVIIYDKALSEEEIKSVNNYIKFKFGIGE